MRTPRPHPALAGGLLLAAALAAVAGSRAAAPPGGPPRRCHPPGPPAENAAVLARIALKDALVADLTAGRAALADTAARFLALDRDRPDLLAFVRDAYPAPTDLGAEARNVLGYAESRVPPGDPGRVLPRLRTEFRALFPDDPAH